MAARNDITGDSIQSRTSNDAYSDGWDRIFSKSQYERMLETEAKLKAQQEELMVQLADIQERIKSHGR